MATTFIEEDRPSPNRQRGGSGNSSAHIQTKSPDITQAPYPVVNAQDDDGGPCGWCGMFPQWARFFNTPKWLLSFMCVAAIAQGMVVNGFVSVSISNLEKRFGLSSTQTGLIASMYDIAVAICLVPVCYMGAYQNKAKWLGYGLIIMALGSFLYSLPHFLVPPYQYQAAGNTSSFEVLCELAPTSPSCSSSSLSSYFYLFMFAQALHGIGASPLYSLGVTYINENVSQWKSGLYLGIFYSTGVIGPAIGYVVGGMQLNIYGEIGRVDTDSIDITSNDPRWYGAWWVGPLYTCVLTLIISIPIMAYPKILPGTIERKSKDIIETQQNKRSKDSTDLSQPGFGRNIKDLPTTIRLLLTNPTYMFTTIADASDGFLLGGFVAFAPKYVEFQFSVSAAFASIITGGVVIMCAAVGTVFGGFVVKHFKLTLLPILKLTGLAVFLSLVSQAGFWFRCETQTFVGITDTYLGEHITLDSKHQTLTSACNEECDCMNTRFTPICSATLKAMYYSPCHAGCESLSLNNITKEYTHCSCLSVYNSNSSSSSSASLLSDVVVEGKCESDCGYLPAFLTCLAFISFFSMMASIPTLEVILRCVPGNIRAVGVGVQWLLVRILGTIPGPIIMGLVIDSTCLHHRRSCDDDASDCLLYDNMRMSTRFFLLSISLKCISLISLFLAYRSYRPPPRPSSSHVTITDTNGSAAHSVGRDNPAFDINSVQ